MPGKQQDPGPSYLDEHHQRISEFAADYFDDDDEREAFVDTLMERRGYVRRSAWAPPDPQPPAPQGGQGGGQPRGGQAGGRAPYFRR